MAGFHAEKALKQAKQAEITLGINIKNTKRVWNQLFLHESDRYDVYLQPHMPQVSYTPVFRKILHKITSQMKQQKKQKSEKSQGKKKKKKI